MNHSQIAKDKNRIIIETHYMDNPYCPVCYSTLFGKTVSHCPCQHIFHSKCLHDWLRSCWRNQVDYSCPLCRLPLNADHLV